MHRSIEIDDLHEDEVRILRDFVSFLKKRKKISGKEEKEWGSLAVNNFAEDWENEKDSLYDNWKEFYHVQER